MEVAVARNRPTPKKWGDSADEVNEDFDKDGKFMDDDELDENGFKTTVEYSTNEKGQKVKTTKKYKVYKKEIKVNKKVEARKRWKKFGECAGLPPGPEKGVTSISDEVYLDLKGAKNQESNNTAAKETSKDPVLSAIVCRNCGRAGEHWTLKCPYKNSLPPSTRGTSSDDMSSLALKPAGAGKYQIPKNRDGASSTSLASSTDSFGRDRRSEEATIRVTNISEDTRESDLNDLFRPFGAISRIYLAKDKHTGQSKGFAFVNYLRREDAARAMEKLQGYGYDHLILRLEWANVKH